MLQLVRINSPSENFFFCYFKKNYKSMSKQIKKIWNNDIYLWHGLAFYPANIFFFIGKQRDLLGDYTFIKMKSDHFCDLSDKSVWFITYIKCHMLVLSLYDK